MGPIPESNCPDGYLICNGQDVSRTKYAELFSLLGTNFGVGDGTTTFNIPDYRGCFLRMLSTDTNENTNMYAKQNSGVPNITGTMSRDISEGSATGSLVIDSGYAGAMWAGATNVNRMRDWSFDASKSSLVYQNGLSEARVTNFAINYYIKY